MKTFFYTLILIILPLIINTQIIYDYSSLPIKSSVDRVSKHNHFLLNSIYDYGGYDNNIPLWVFGNSKIKRLTYFDNGKVNNGVITYESSQIAEYNYDNNGRILSYKTVNTPIGSGFIEFQINYEQSNKITFQLKTDEELERGYLIVENEKIIEYYDEFQNSNGTWNPQNNWFYNDYDVCGNYTKRKAKYEGGTIKDEIITLAYNSLNNCTINKWQNISWNYDAQGRLLGRNNVNFELDSQNRIHKIPVGSTSTRRFDYEMNGKVSSVVISSQTNRDSIAFEYVDIQSSSNDEQDDNRISIYPNPATQMLNIEVEHLIWGNFSYRLYNSIGQQVHKGIIESKLNSVDISGFARGIYFLQVQNEKKITNYRIIIQ